MTPLLERFEGLMIPEPNSGCWLWTGAVDHRGYGRIFVDGKNQRAHRISYELYIGTIPNSFQLDHGCRVRCCVNPAHLEPVTPQINTNRGDAGKYNKVKTHCKWGHPFAGENLYVCPKTGKRKCKICTKVRHQSRKLAARAQREIEGAR